MPHLISALPRRLTPLPPDKEIIIIIQKATVYDIKRILKENPDKTYTTDQLEKLLDAYITGAEQYSKHT